MMSFVVQARIDSTRLPRKAITPLWKNLGMLELILQYLSQNFPKIDIVVATTLKSSDDKIEQICNKAGVNCYRGEEKNVLKRIVDTAKFYNINEIIRVCSDNPFLQRKFIKMLIDYTEEADYIACAVEGKPSILTHYGFFVERVKMSALERTQNLTVDPLYQEHVTNFIYLHPKDYNLKFFEIGGELSNLKKTRFTVDDESDFFRAKKIFSTFNRYPDLDDLERFIYENPHEMISMKKSIEKYQK